MGGRRKKQLESALDERLDALAGRRAGELEEVPEEETEARQLQQLLAVTRFARELLQAEPSPTAKARHLQMLMEAALAPRAPEDGPEPPAGDRGSD